MDDRRLRSIIVRIRDEADIAARPGQHDRLHDIADELLDLIDRDDNDGQ